MDDIVARLRVVIRDAIGSKADITIPVTAPLAEVVTSSLSFVVILGEIERVFGVVLPDEALNPEALGDLKSIATLIQRLLPKAS